MLFIKDENKTKTSSSRTFFLKNAGLKRRNSCLSTGFRSKRIPALENWRFAVCFHLTKPSRICLALFTVYIPFLDPKKKKLNNFSTTSSSLAPRRSHSLALVPAPRPPRPAPPLVAWLRVLGFGWKNKLSQKLYETVTNQK